jgi:hypothetical protein
VPALGTQAPALASANVTYVKIYAEQADKCLDNPQNSLANDTGMDIYTCLTPLPQNEQWVQDPAAHAGYFYFYNVKSQKCLTVKGGNVANNTLVQQYTCNYGANQSWDVTNF